MNISLTTLFPSWQGTDVSVASLTLDSRQVAPGCLFLAVPGARHDGRHFIARAIEQGAVAVAYECADGFQPERAATDDIPYLPVAGLAGQVSAIAGRFYQQPDRDLGVIGITGTNGKTSVSQMLAQALTRLGQPCGVIGTLGSGLLDRLQTHGMTTPDAISVQQQLAQMHADGARWVSMEVSSHALDQERVAAVDFSVAIFTNLSRDHLDYHGDMTSYAAAKAQLFARPLHTAVVNADDQAAARMLLDCSAPVIRFSQQDPQAELYAADVRQDAGGLHARLCYQDQSYPLHSSLLGRFNLSNLLAVGAGLLALGIEPEQALEQLSCLQAPAGRMQRFGGTDQPLVVVDYAHTPDALTQVLTALRDHTNGRLVCVFGCGGDRDRGKRPLMAQAVEAHADALVLTDDNPRTEPSAQIIADMRAGLQQPDKAAAITPRSIAIQQTIAHASVSDVILLAGKGHEDYQEIDGVRHPFSDLQEAASALATWRAAHA
ncbi:UDP-N-acetylmuramoyl-L-alanyl-D-glutamate--2,6-diaminopimelate ligase [Halopseudomonas salegens]|uniref:UDP-N-acetylmuramoyl-L-alanyl-D-glutamate--2,6-diaminopimelate ligase n=1 Tax=Halopseudomonas salegens TaxID=1434072 RepID=A0A1H2GRG3_9GAMM|nr:UDP-N-acetylmuramoyl-L-alanyl-D-glutamate--2,6-diaminopimelate ligase [Halopseudomonas salegens]SDU22303.1 UDP-N-acetylmuramoylalanyl-D-glutamate--2,6-diaminopimelate ligase [Halopseudomonas salegens]